jgi:parvulin-like peptidyl-prolyl isomerase
MQKSALALGLLVCSAFAAHAADNSAVVVSQGTAKITLDDVDAYVHRVPANDRVAFIAKPERIEAMLRNMLLDKQLAAEARQLGLEKDPIAQRQIELAIDNALSRIRVEALTRNLKAPDFTEQAREDYLANKPKYREPAVHDVKHILIGTKSRTVAEAQALANETLEKVKKDPSSFDALVTSLSDDESKTSNHGLMPNASSEQFVRPFADAAAKMTKPGELSDVVQTQFGFHILQLVTYKPAEQKTYEQVADSIRTRLTNEWTEAQVRSHIDALRNQPMQPNPEELAKLPDRFGKVQFAPEKAIKPSEAK